MSKFVLMAGGTGGHLFPALALAQELRRRGHIVALMTDARVADHGEQFPAREIFVIPSATPSTRNVFKLVAAGAVLAWGTGVAWGKLGRVRPDAVVAFGGYPTVPPFLAARLRGVPGIVHEANGVLGRANRLLGRWADVVALSFADTARVEAYAKKAVLTGVPVRDTVRGLAATAYPVFGADEVIELLVFGGSQGARVFADLVPEAISQLPAPLRARLRVTQQCRPEDLDRVTASYRAGKVNVELAAFFSDLPERMAKSHLVISRSGASTVAELCVLGRPAILVPLPGSIDADQKTNAQVIAGAGAGWIAEQATLSPLSLATRLEDLLARPDTLAEAASAARGLGQPDAVGRLAELAETLAGIRAGANKTGQTS